jgi:hypothetical protein
MRASVYSGQVVQDVCRKQGFGGLCEDGWTPQRPGQQPQAAPHHFEVMIAMMSAGD